MNLRICLITVVTIAISIVHIFPANNSDMVFHTLHQQLFYIPLIMASFWFGIIPGAIVALGISFIYGAPLILGEHGHTGHFLIITQIILYLLITTIVGWLSDLQRKQEHSLLEGERVTTFGRAASALSFEVQDIAHRIEDIFKSSDGLKDGTANKDMLGEILRLELLLEALGQFKPAIGDLTLSKDFNEVVKNNLDSYRVRGKQKGVKIVLNLDSKGCPSIVESDEILSILESLVSNAIDFSTKGQTITIQTKVGSDASTIEVVDQGSGVKKENETKLFGPFFTTKSDGYGLSLSSGRKTLRRLGGDLVYEPGKKGGAIFKMIIPRDPEGENFNEYVKEKVNHRSIKQ